MPAKSTPVSRWLDQHFRAWRAAQSGHRAGVTHFARYLGISRDDLNNYLLRGVCPEGERLARIGRALGPEIYDLLDLPRPDPQLQQVTDAFLRLPAAERGVAEAVLQQPGLLAGLAHWVAPRTGRRRRPEAGSAKEAWRRLIDDLDDAQVLRLLAVAQAMRDQELKEKGK